MKTSCVLFTVLFTVAIGARIRHLQPNDNVDIQALLKSVSQSPAFKAKVEDACVQDPNYRECRERTTQFMFCNLLRRNKPEAFGNSTCPGATAMSSVVSSSTGNTSAIDQDTIKTDPAVKTNNTEQGAVNVADERTGSPNITVFSQMSLHTRRSHTWAPEDDLAKEMTHDLEMNFNKIAPFGKEDTAKELQDHAAKTQDTLVDAVENAEVAEIKRAVFRALTRLRAATIKEFDTIARLETQAIDAYNDAHHYRAENPLTHLHEDEAPVETDKLKSFH
jgi:hypothetical protein